jgi:hypothetical protein
MARVVFTQGHPCLDGTIRLPGRAERLISMLMVAPSDAGATSGAAGAMRSNAASLVNLITLRRTSTLGAEQHQRPNDLIFR